MAIPTAIQQRRNALEAAQPSKETTPPVVNTASPAPTPTPTPAPITPSLTQIPETGLAQVQTLKEEVKDAAIPEDFAAKLKKIEDGYLSDRGRFRDLENVHKQDEELLRVQEAQRQFLESKLQEQKARADEAERKAQELEQKMREIERAKTAVPKFEIDDVQIDPEELSGFEPSAIKILEKLSKKELAKIAPILQALTQKINMMEEQMQSVVSVAAELPEIKNTAAVAATAAAKDVEVKYWDKSLKNRHPDWQVFTQSPVWKKFLGQEIADLPGVTKQNMLNAYRQQKNVAGVISILDDFKSWVNANGKPAMHNLAEPSGVPGQPNVNSTSAPSRKFKNSDLKAATTEFQKGKLSLADYQKLKAEFKQQLLAGKVEADVPL